MRAILEKLSDKEIPMESMKVRDLIALLESLPGNTTAYVQITDPETGEPMLAAIAGVEPAISLFYGNAAIIELEESA